jgi:Family of unknown function (DUF6758)
MKAALSCPRCGGQVHEPSAWTSAWRCDEHGDVHPLHPACSPSPDGLEAVVRIAAVPVWLPWPLPMGWLVTGFAKAGDDRSGARACVVAVSGPNPVGGPGDMLLVAEEPGVGLGAHLAGIGGPDPGQDFVTQPPHAWVRYGKREFPLWHVDAPDRAAFAGEAMGYWLWVVLWPATAGVLLVEPLSLRDLRDPEHALDVPYGALSPRLPKLA